MQPLTFFLNILSTQMRIKKCGGAHPCASTYRFQILNLKLLSHDDILRHDAVADHPEDIDA